MKFSSRQKATFRFIVFLGLGVWLMYLVFKGADWRRMAKDLLAADFRFVFIAFALGVVALWSRAARWLLILKPMGYNTDIKRSFISLCLGYLANIGFPRAGELARCTALNQLSGLPVAALFGTVILERLLDLLMLLGLLVWVVLGSVGRFGAFFQSEFSQRLKPLYPFWQLLKPWQWLIMLLISALVVLYLMQLAYKKLKHSESKLAMKISATLFSLQQGLTSFNKLEHKGAFVLHTLFIWFAYIGMSYFIFFAYAPTKALQLFDAVFLTVVGGLGMSAPVQGGFGAYHYLVEKAMQLYGIVPEVMAETGQVYSPGLVFATLVHSTQFLMVLLCGILALIAFYILKKPMAK